MIRVAPSVTGVIALGSAVAVAFIPAGLSGSFLHSGELRTGDVVAIELDIRAQPDQIFILYPCHRRTILADVNRNVLFYLGIDGGAGGNRTHV